MASERTSERVGIEEKRRSVSLRSRIWGGLGVGSGSVSLREIGDEVRVDRAG